MHRPTTRFGERSVKPAAYTRPVSLGFCDEYEGDGGEMYVPDDLKGLNGMIAACATEGATDLEAEDTVDVDNQRDFVDRLVRDGVNVISVMGSYGEFHTLTDNEFK